MSIYRLQKMEGRNQQFDRLAKLWGEMPEGPEKGRVQDLYRDYSRGTGGLDGEALERAFMEVMEGPDRSREAMDAGAEEYEEIIALQALMGDK